MFRIFSKSLVIVGICLLACNNLQASNGDEFTNDTIPEYSLKELENRYGKKAAFHIHNHSIEVGFSRTMVLLAKGHPHVIEQPMGKYMDFEIFHYQDCTVFFEYGIVTNIKVHPKNSSADVKVLNN
jgi:hypothetical protein